MEMNVIGHVLFTKIMNYCCMFSMLIHAVIFCNAERNEYKRTCFRMPFLAFLVDSQM